jgi:hypothetical protein
MAELLPNSTMTYYTPSAHGSIPDDRARGPLFSYKAQQSRDVARVKVGSLLEEGATYKIQEPRPGSELESFYIYYKMTLFSNHSTSLGFNGGHQTAAKCRPIRY